ncbi:MAG TPA: hypothetical protein PKN12_03045 [Bacteroidales bacterium]|nr:hypothetical protein [Bacteroidales bacterium]HPT10531.1 hypothetical protein [Bacteroidales bacterium]
MKKHALLLAVLAVLLVNNIQAAIWRVNNNPGINANFTSFTAAQNVASNGDTLYFEGSPVSYGDITITKPLVIIGPGYFLTENLQTQANPVSAQFGTVNFNAGSSGSILCGSVVEGVINIKVGNILLKGNYCKNDISLINTTSFSNIYVIKNYIVEDDYSSVGIHVAQGSLQINNIVICNNYITGSNRCIDLPNNCNCIISNNVLINSMNVYNSIVSNNIQKTGNQTLNNNYYYNNIGSGTQFPSGNGNQQSIDMANVFVGATGNSTDGQWQLKEYSPAIGAGNDGLDCGMFGGTDPYVLSGMPDIPSIYQIIMPTSGNTNTGINVTVKAKSH